MQLCRHLRWKALYGQRYASVEELELAFTVADAPFSCLHSCQPWGPDEDVAEPGRCQPGRACFERSELDPGRWVS